MSQEGFALSATLKGGTGFDAPWVVVYGNTPDEVEGKLRGVIQTGLIEATVEAANALKAANNAGPLAPQGQEAVQQAPAQQAPPAPAQPQGWGQQAPQQQPAPQAGPVNGTPHPEGKTCPACGQVVQYKAFTSKAGRDFKLWSCPNQRQKGDGHFSEFI